MTPAQVRKLALALPETEERDHFGNPSFRTTRAIFATLQVDRRTAHLLKLEPDEVASLGDAPGFSVQHWGKQSYLRAALAEVDASLFEELLVTCWRRVASKRALAAFDGGETSAPIAKRPRKRRG